MCAADARSVGDSKVLYYSLLFLFNSNSEYIPVVSVSILVSISLSIHNNAADNTIQTNVIHYEGRSINELQNDIILLIFKM